MNHGGKAFGLEAKAALITDGARGHGAGIVAARAQAGGGVQANDGLVKEGWAALDANVRAGGTAAARRLVRDAARWIAGLEVGINRGQAAH